MTTSSPDAPPGTGSGRVSPVASLRGSLRVPADKSVAHRALLFNAMGEGRTTVSLHQPGEDVLSMAGALAAVGAIEAKTNEGASDVAITIQGGGTAAAARLPGSGGETLDCGNAGTAMRLLAGALSGRPGTATLVGDDSLSARPMERVAEPLRRMGADVRTSDGHAPLEVHGHAPLEATRHDVPVASAQVIGSLTLAALAAQGTTTIRVPGPTRDHTERMLGWLGAPVRREGLVTTIEGPAGFAARSLVVPGDISSAAYWLVAGALHPAGDIRIVGVGLNPSRVGIIEVLREMGADIEVVPEPDPADAPEPTGTLHIRGGRSLRGIEIAGDRVADVIDELPLLAVAMAAAEGQSTVRDAAELRVKESDRIRLVVENLAAIGAQVEERADGWMVTRGAPRQAVIRTAGDHRIAMAFAVAALAGVARGVRIDDPHCAAVSYPSFWTDLESLAP